MSRPARSHRRSTRGGLPLAAVLVALMAVGPASAVGPRLAQAVSASMSEEEVGHEYIETRRCARPLVGPPAPSHPVGSADRSVPPPEPRVLPRHLRPSAPARGPDGPYLRC
jgi:hypothetical protein